MKCKNCGHKAKWISNTYPSPLCSHCTRVQVNKLIKQSGEKNETAVTDYYSRLEEPTYQDEIVTFDVKTGEISKEKKHGNKD